MDTFVIIKDAVLDVKKSIETSASKNKIYTVENMLDACTCTGNCV